MRFGMSYCMADAYHLMRYSNNLTWKNLATTIYGSIPTNWNHKTLVAILRIEQCIPLQQEPPETNCEQQGT